MNQCIHSSFRYSEGEIHFNLMALVSDRQMIYQRQIDALLGSTDGDVDMQAGPEVARLRMLIEDEVAKKKRYKVENIRRKHNYLPLIVELLKMLAEQGKLLPIYEKAKARAQEREAVVAKKWEYQIGYLCNNREDIDRLLIK